MVNDFILDSGLQKHNFGHIKNDDDRCIQKKNHLYALDMDNEYIADLWNILFHESHSVVSIAMTLQRLL